MMVDGASDAHKRLDAFVGEWQTEGEISAGPSGPAIKFRARDTYEWLPGGYFLLHRWDADMPDGKTEGIEIIGYDSSSGTYRLRSFDDRGNEGVMEAVNKDDRWTFTGETTRFTGVFRDGSNILTGEWEMRSDDNRRWQPWMKVILTKV